MARERTGETVIGKGGAVAVLDYRTPGTGPPRVQQVIAALTSAERVTAATVVAKLAFGVPLCFLGPLLLTWMVTALDRRTGLDALPGFAIVFAVAALVLVPLLMWTERRSRGEFFTNAVRGETSPLDASSYGEYQLQSAKFSWIFFTELALTGPRLVWDAIDGTTGRTVIDSPTRAAAAQVVVDLLDAGEGLPIVKLRRTDQTPAGLTNAIRYLKEHDWIDVSSRGDRAWLTSWAIERLQAV